MKHESTIQQIKLNNLFKDRKSQHDPQKIVFNFSSSVLSEAERSLILKGLNFSIPPKKLNHVDYLVNSELFYRDIYKLDVLSAEDLDFIKTKTKDIALSSFHTYNNNVPQRLSKREFDVLKTLTQNKHIIIQKSEQGNSIVLLTETSILKKMENFLSDQSKFQKATAEDSEFLNFITGQEKHINKIYKNLVDAVV